MDVKMPESLFFMDLPDLRELCSVKLCLNPGNVNPCIRDAQIKLCRHMLFLYDQIVASPNPEQFDQITVIMAISFYRTGKIQSIAEQFATKMESPEKVTPGQLQACLTYTITLRLSPHWNKAGHLLIQGADFLSKSGKQDAVDLHINVSDDQICICVQVQKIQLPPSEVSDFNVSYGALQKFSNDPNFVIERHFIPNNWCYILPSLKMGQIVSIGHTISSETPFKTYRDFQIYWNMLYGYELPCVPEDEAVYCNVYFKLIGEKLFTYPFICIRSQPIQFYPRTDMARIANDFICDLKFKMPHLCGFPLCINDNPAYTVMELTRPHSQSKTNPVNLTTTVPSGLLSQNSRYNAETSQKMVLVKQTVEKHVFEKYEKEQLAKPTSVRHEGTVQRYVPVFHRNNVNPGHFQLSTQDKSKFNSCITHSLKERNPTSLTVSSVMVLSNPTQPLFSQIIDTKTKLPVKKFTNRSMIIKSTAEINRTMNATQHPNAIATGKYQLSSASCQMQVKSKPVVNPKGAKPLRSHTSDGCEINCIEQIPANISHKNQNARPTSTEFLTGEVKEQYFDLNTKRCRTKQNIKDVDVLKHAKNNQLHKLNNATLQNWLKQRGVSTKARSTKEQLVAKIMQFLQEC